MKNYLSTWMDLYYSVKTIHKLLILRFKLLLRLYLAIKHLPMIEGILVHIRSSAGPAHYLDCLSKSGRERMVINCVSHSDG